jgi:hypothetical protein
MKWALEGQEWEIVEWGNLVQEWEIWRAPVNRVIRHRVPYGVGKFCYQLSHC